MNIKRRVSLFLVAVLLTTLFASCGDASSGQLFRYDLSGVVHNLDPQYATDSDAKMVMHSLFEGLVHKMPNGEILPLVAKSWIMSEDGLSYTFYLHEDRKWAAISGSKDTEKTPVTASDFLFSFQRMFESGSSSPYQQDFSAIVGAKEIPTGQKQLGELGVTAKGEYELEFQLSIPDALFLEKLASSGAFPCHKDFFDQAKGRYGLGIKLIVGNGPFSIYQWKEDEYITVRQNGNYVSDTPVIAQGVNFFVNRANKEELFLSGKADVIAVKNSSLKNKILDESGSLVESPEIVWGIVFNAEDEIWGMPLLRQALAATADYEQLEAQLSSSFQITSKIIPEATRLGDKPLTTYVMDSPILFDKERGRELYDFSLTTLGVERMPKVVLHVPETGNHGQYMSLFQQGWQQHLSLYINIQTQTQEELDERLRSGAFQMMLVPISSRDDSAASLLGAFSKPNEYRYDNPVYDEFIVKAGQSSSLEEMGDYYRYAHNTILDDGEVIPVYSEPVYYALGTNVEGLEIHPFGSVIGFKNGRK